MSFKAGVFTSNAVCTYNDLVLEAAINKKLPRGRVTCWSLSPEARSAQGDEFYINYSYNGQSKTFTRRAFDLDIDEFVDGLAITAHGLANARLSGRYVYDSDNAEAMPQWVRDALDADI